MIILILSGGLGNQMFEYAAARAMALRCNTELVVNTNLGFKRDRIYHRVYSIDYYDIKFIRKKLLSFDFIGGHLLAKISRIIGHHIFFPWYRFLYDKKIEPEELKNNPYKYKNIILVGEFVRPEFFDDYTNIILKDYKIRKEFLNNELVDYYISLINNSKIPIVALCVRIYQEIKNEKFRSTEFYAQSEYYNNALKYFKKKIGNFKVLIFSQAKDWVLNNIDFNEIEYEYVHVSEGDRDAALELQVLSHCNHYIISNSSYYFWGVFLNRNNKIVIVPKKWEIGVLKEWIKL